MSDWLNSREQEVSCFPGCRGCCDLSVGITALEAELLSVHIPRTETERWHRQARRIEALSRNVLTDSEFFYTYRTHIGSCLFLGSDGECTVYHDRPLSCRMLLTDLGNDFCNVDFARNGSEAGHTRYLERADNPGHAGPWLRHPVHMAREFENTLHQMTIREWGISYSGVLPIMVSLAMKGFFQNKAGMEWLSGENEISSLVFQTIQSI